jgi:hypothetical protein
MICTVMELGWPSMPLLVAATVILKFVLKQLPSSQGIQGHYSEEKMHISSPDAPVGHGHYAPTCTRVCCELLTQWLFMAFKMNLGPVYGAYK